MAFGEIYTLKRKHKLSGFISGLAGDLFEVPTGAVPGGWSVTVTDGREAYMTGCRAILSYDPDAVTVDVGDRLLKIIGRGLDISRYTDSEITVRGEIVSVTEEGEEC